MDIVSASYNQSDVQSSSEKEPLLTIVKRSRWYKVTKAVFTVITIVLQYVVPVAMISVGLIYSEKKYCPSSHLALLMITGGSGIMSYTMVDALKKYRKRSVIDGQRDKLVALLNWVLLAIALLEFAWVIIACVLVFRIWPHVSYDESNPFYCNKLLMRLSFWIVLVTLITFGIFLASVLCISGCVIFFAALWNE